MPVGGCHLKQHLTAQNDPSVTMGGPLASLRAAISVVRMILLIIVACGFCLTGCLGQSPANLMASKDTLGHRRTMTHSGTSSQASAPDRSDGQQKIFSPVNNQINIEHFLNFMRMVNANVGTGQNSHLDQLTSQSNSESSESRLSSSRDLIQQYPAMLSQFQLSASIDILMSGLEDDQPTETLETLVKKLGRSPRGREFLKSLLNDQRSEHLGDGRVKRRFDQLKQMINQNIVSKLEDSDIDDDRYLQDTLQDRRQDTVPDRRQDTLQDRSRLLLDTSILLADQFKPSGSVLSLFPSRQDNSERTNSLSHEVTEEIDSQHSTDNEIDDSDIHQKDDDILSDDDDIHLKDDDILSDDLSPQPIAWAHDDHGSVSSDREFWNSLSTYLDAPYLKRIRRNAEEYKRVFKQKLRARLSVTYGHVMPCEYRDRFYCMNSGTCVFVGALKIKTCRCPLGYTGHRCMMIDQEYILSLINDYISS